MVVERFPPNISSLGIRFCEIAKRLSRKHAEVFTVGVSSVARATSEQDTRRPIKTTPPFFFTSIFQISKLKQPFLGARTTMDRYSSALPEHSQPPWLQQSTSRTARLAESCRRLWHCSLPPAHSSRSCVSECE
jgi:hypothetical protein